MKYIILFLLSIFFSCGGKDWIRELPKKEYDRTQEISGVFERRTNPKSAMNSNFHKNFWKEKIIFQKNGCFEKIYEKIDYFGESKTSILVVGRGFFQKKGNWVLLKTNEITRTENEKNPQTKNMNHSLLYHFDENSKTIIPMIFESGYEEKSFGVCDGVKVPYEEDRHFFLSRKIYTLKDFQPHAYFQVK